MITKITNVYATEFDEVTTESAKVDILCLFYFYQLGIIETDAYLSRDFADRTERLVVDRVWGHSRIFK